MVYMYVYAQSDLYIELWSTYENEESISSSWISLRKKYSKNSPPQAVKEFTIHKWITGIYLVGGFNK